MCGHIKRAARKNTHSFFQFPPTHFKIFPLSLLSSLLSPLFLFSPLPFFSSPLSSLDLFFPVNLFYPLLSSPRRRPGVGGGGGDGARDPAAAAIPARIRQPAALSPAGSRSPPLPFIPSTDPAEGRSIGGGVAGGERG